MRLDRALLAVLATTLVCAVARAYQTPCEVKAAYETAEHDLSVLVLQFPEPADPQLTEGELEQLHDLQTMEAKYGKKTEKQIRAELDRIAARIKELNAGEADAITLANDVAILKRNIATLEDDLNKLADNKAQVKINKAVEDQKDAELSASRMYPGASLNGLRSMIVTQKDCEIPTADVKKARQRYDEAKSVGVKDEMDAAAKALANAKETAIDVAKHFLDKYDAADAALAEVDLTGTARETMTSIEALKEQLATKEAKLQAAQKQPDKPGDKSAELTRLNSEAADTRGGLDFVVYRDAKLKKLKALRDNEKAWNDYQAHTADRAKLQAVRDTAVAAVLVVEKKKDALIADDKKDLLDLPNRIEKNPKPEYKASGVKLARSNEGLKQLLQQANGNKKDKKFQDEAKRLIYNEVRRLERDQLMKRADDLSNYDCWEDAKTMVEKLISTSRSPLLAEQHALAGKDQDLGTADNIPDVYKLPDDGDGPTTATTSGPVWELQEPVIEAGANCKVSASGGTVNSLDEKKSSASISWSTPPATVHQGDEITLTMTATPAEKPAWALGWFNVGCGGKYTVKDNNVATWADGKRSGEKFDAAKLVFTFSGGGDAYIQVQFGQEPGTSRWGTVTWKYKEKK